MICQLSASCFHQSAVLLHLLFQHCLGSRSIFAEMWQSMVYIWNRDSSSRRTQRNVENFARYVSHLELSVFFPYHVLIVEFFWRIYLAHCRIDFVISRFDQACYWYSGWLVLYFFVFAMKFVWIICLAPFMRHCPSIFIRSYPY